MWVEWFIRYSKSISKWPFKFFCDGCKRRRYLLSFSPLLFTNNRKIDNISLHKYDWEDNQRRYSRNKYQTKSTTCASSIIGALTSAAVIFSWKNDGVTDEELQEASSDEYLLNMTHDKIDEVLVSLGWEKVIRKDHLLLYRKYNNELQIYSYKILGTFNDISALVFFQVQLDLEYRMKWDDHALRLSVIDTDENTHSDIVHWIQKFPFPFNHRDYLYVRRYCLDAPTDAPPKIIIKCHSINHPNVHDDQKCVRVSKYESSMIIQSKHRLEEKGMKFLLTYHEDAKASIPTSTYSYLAQSGIPDFVEKLHIASKKLPKFAIGLNGNLYLFANESIASPVVSTTSGQFAGFTIRQTNVWIVIPYATPPIDAFRWLKAQPYVMTDSQHGTIQNATNYSPSCLQINREGLILGPTDEDCLHLNVWAPTKPSTSSAGYPVMLWIHGGAFIEGSATQVIYDGLSWTNAAINEKKLLHHGQHSISIKPNGIFFSIGFIRDNIAQFGGDKNSVTLMGQSAGSRPVCIHIVSPLSASLFHAGILDNGSCDTLIYLRDKSFAYSTTQNLASLVGFNQVPISIGVNHDEFVLRTLYEDYYHPPISTVDYLNPILPIMTYNHSEIQALYIYTPNQFSGNYSQAFVALLSQEMHICSSRRTAGYMSRQPTYLYTYNHAPEYVWLTTPNLIMWPGAYHSAELFSLFQTLTASLCGNIIFKSDELPLATTVRRYWTNMITKRQPNGNVNLIWSQYVFV
ncbi:unnamed protein product [Rotaria socialis]|uniref:Phosphatidylcholine transfer protein n=1 Tax=Rotaria socialis TaxID=392032 RepID=A0A821HL44_9BILA|nr:unnamed protein product [Rotaria socialis]CAF4686247.1 unnamed protein product [Rotaria socialis]